MNYTKAQQEFVAYILGDTPRRPGYFHDKVNAVTLLVDPNGYYGYLVPDCAIAINLAKCTELYKFPFPPCPAEEAYELTTDGSTVPSSDGKRALLVFKTREGAARYLDKKLHDKFGKGARFFQEKDLGVCTVAEKIDKDFLVIGYVCPCKVPKANVQK